MTDLKAIALVDCDGNQWAHVWFTVDYATGKRCWTNDIDSFDYPTKESAVAGANQHRNINQET